MKKIIALASAQEKLELVSSLGADVTINYSDPHWAKQVREATDGRGVDIVLEQTSGEVGDHSFQLAAPLGRIVLFGAKNIHDTLSSERVQQIIYRNQTVVGFNLPSMKPDLIAACVPGLLSLIAQKKIKMFAANTFPLAEVKSAFAALSSRQTIGKVVLVP